MTNTFTAPPRRPGTAALILLGLACMGYAFVCGMTGGQVVLFLTTATELGQASEEEFDLKKEESLAGLERFLIDTVASGPSEVTGWKEAMDNLRLLDSQGFLRVGVLALAESPSRDRLTMLAKLDTAVRFSFFVLALLLMLRLPFARWAGLAVCLFAIGVQIAFWSTSTEVLTAMADAMQPPFDAAAAEHGLSMDYDPNFLSDKLGQLPRNVLVGPAMIFPVIALLLFLFAKPLRRALGEQAAA